MAWRKPILKVVNTRSGNDIMPKMKGNWISVTVTDCAGQKSDSAQIVCVYRKGMWLPAKKEPFEIYMGWADEGYILQGRYTVQKYSREGNPENGHILIIELRSADFVDKLKASGRKHYDDATFGEIVKDVAKTCGLEANVDPELENIKLGYRVRWDQSPVDFLTEISEEIGATTKPSGGKLISMKRGSGRSAGGKDLPEIHIKYSKSHGYKGDFEPRPEVRKVVAAWFDQDTGRRKIVSEETEREGSIYIIPQICRTEEEAKETVKAQSFESNSNSGSATFDVPGMSNAWAEAKVTVEGYGYPIDGNWIAERVEKTINKDDGFFTSISVKAGKDAKAKGQKGKGSGGNMSDDEINKQAMDLINNG